MADVICYSETVSSGKHTFQASYQYINYLGNMPNSDVFPNIAQALTKMWKRECVCCYKSMFALFMCVRFDCYLFKFEGRWIHEGAWCPGVCRERGRDATPRRRLHQAILSHRWFVTFPLATHSSITRCSLVPCSYVNICLSGHSIQDKIISNTSQLQLPSCNCW